MKKSCQAFIVLLFTFFSFSLFAQDGATSVKFANGKFITGDNVTTQRFKKADIAGAYANDHYYVLVQFVSFPSAQEQLQLKKAGIELHDHISNRAYLATIKNNFDFAAAKGLNITAINSIPSVYKIDPALINYQASYDKANNRFIAISFFASVEKIVVQEAVQNLGAAIVTTKFNGPNVIFIQVDPQLVNKIAALPFVSYVGLQSMKDKSLNYNNVAAHGVSGLNAAGGKNLNGKGITLGIGDNSDVSTHIDFSGRLINRSPWIPEDHGTHVTGTAAGAGIINIKNHGMAPKARIINQLFSDIIFNAPTYITDYKMVLSNNSYYSTDPGCPGSRKYDVLSNYADIQLKNFPQLLHVVASGNDGSFTCDPLPPSFGTVKSGWQAAKNVLTVGAINTEDYSIAYFSSRGPMEDGRIKPEITSGGWAILSTNAFNTYGVNFGTSMASPAVTGSLALMYERYRQVNAGADPAAALMKAIVCNTAEDLGNPGPDYTFGFGMLNARRAVDAIDSVRYVQGSVANATNTSQVIHLPKNARRLKVMLYWADKEAASNASAALVNDLDLTVTTPGTVLHRPLILDPAPANLNNNATEGADHTNNIEQVVIENPAEGDYTVAINGFAVPFGPQAYILTWEIIDSSVVLEYPAGGETLVPGETETIRWEGYGNESNTFSLEYSTDNGNNWTVIDNNIPAASRSYKWVVPSTVTTQGLIRVNRNGSAFTDKNKFNFTVLGQPSLTTSNVCEGAVQLSWSAITGATEYDVLELSGDSMQVIASVSATSFIVPGLDKYKQYWFGVRAKTGAVTGRRSVSVSAVPGNGTCTLALFDNDIKIDSILEPASARQYFSNQGNATKPVKVLIRNLGTVATTGPFDVSFSYYEGSPVITETISPTIPAGASYTHTFTGNYIVVPEGFKYDFKAWTTKAADGNHANDTAYKVIKSINNDMVVLPVAENFESMPVAEYKTAELAIGENKRLDFSANSLKGRARTFVNTGFARSGSKAITLDQAPYGEETTVDSLTVNYNLLFYSAGLSQLRFDFYFKNHGQEAAPDNKVWVRGNESNEWVEAYDLYANQAGLGQWKHGYFNINEVLGTAVPPQTVSASFQVKIGQEGYTSANAPDPQTDIDDGYTIDDLLLSEAFNDVAVTNIISPDRKGCSLTAANPISVTVKNFSNTVLNNLQVSYQVNSNPVVTESIASIAANQALDYTFLQKADLSAYVDYTIKVWVKSATDSYSSNDSILDFVVHNSPVVSAYPYVQGFENNDGGFYSKGKNNSWEWGLPAKTIINKAANGTKAWVTNLTGKYRNNEISYLYSPCFDLSTLTSPMLSFSHIYDIELDYDYTWLEYSTDGTNWQKLGTSGTGTNWYDNAKENWKSSNLTWHVASIPLPPVAGTVRFRFVLSSDGGVTQEGIGIDDVHVFDRAAIYTGTPVTGITQNVSGNGWIDFNTGGKRVAAINPNGMNLGSTAVEVHPYSGQVRYRDNQYYLNRNIVIHPQNPPSGYVTVRFYFTDAEANSLINASGCSSCSERPKDAYELGVIKYNGPLADENGTMNDDTQGFFQYILPANTLIIPYDSGYYAEFDVSSFSEFWLSNGGIDTSPVPLNLLSFNASKQDKKVLLQWATENEINTHSFTVERSLDNLNYSTIGTIPANGRNGVNQYSLTDETPFAGMNFYRLKLLDRGGAIKYSPVRKVFFANGDGIVLYPNPVKGGKVYLSSTDDCIKAMLMDASGKQVRLYTLTGTYNELNVTGIAKGVYQLKIITTTSTHTEKIVVQ